MIDGIGARLKIGDPLYQSFRDTVDTYYKEQLFDPESSKMCEDLVKLFAVAHGIPPEAISIQKMYWYNGANREGCPVYSLILEEDAPSVYPDKQIGTVVSGMGQPRAMYYSHEGESIILSFDAFKLQDDDNRRNLIDMAERAAEKRGIKLEDLGYKHGKYSTAVSFDDFPTPVPSDEIQPDSFRAVRPKPGLGTIDR
jgi:hypothetical protein